MAYLIVMEGPSKGKRFELSGQVQSIGRKDGNDIVIDGPAVSGTHCKIEKQDDRYRLSDLNSTNGTRVNNELVDSAELSQNDVITLGSTPVMIVGDDLPAAESRSEKESSPSSTSRVLIRPLTSSGSEPVPRPKAFGKRRDSRRIWIIVLTVVGALVLLAGAWFLRTLFR